MVYYFQSTAVSPPAFIYVGKDKVESMFKFETVHWKDWTEKWLDEDLIKFGWQEDVCYRFHADNLSSAHVYLRMKPGEAWSSIPQDLLEDCAQLTKANSIEGNKKDNVTIIYTPWSNLMKNASMTTGQVSFHDHKMTKKVLVPARQNLIVNRLNRTKTEKFPDLNNEKKEDLKQKRKVEGLALEEKKTREKQEKKEREEKRWQKDHAYDDLMNEDEIAASSNQDRDADFLDDFM